MKEKILRYAPVLLVLVGLTLISACGSDEDPIVPTITDLEISVDEGVDDGTLLASPEVDMIEGEPGFRIVTGNEAGIFAINTTTGELSIADGVALDFESQSSYVLTVEVSTSGGSAEGTVTITVNDANFLRINGEQRVVDFVVITDTGIDKDFGTQGFEISVFTVGGFIDQTSGALRGTFSFLTVNVNLDSERPFTGDDLVVNLQEKLPSTISSGLLSLDFMPETQQAQLSDLVSGGSLRFDQLTASTFLLDDSTLEFLANSTLLVDYRGEIFLGEEGGRMSKKQLLMLHAARASN